MCVNSSVCLPLARITRRFTQAGRTESNTSNDCFDFASAEQLFSQEQGVQNPLDLLPAWTQPFAKMAVKLDLQIGKVLGLSEVRSTKLDNSRVAVTGVFDTDVNMPIGCQTR